MTITEGLAEITTIGKRIAKKQQSIIQYVARNDQLKDPLEKEGGSAKFIASELRAITDLQKRIVDLRTAIQKANMATTLNVNDFPLTIFQWLTYRREVAPVQKKYLDDLWNGIQHVRTTATEKGMKIRTATEAVQNDTPTNDVIVNINEVELSKKREQIETIMGELDGRLSLLNATTQIEI